MSVIPKAKSISKYFYAETISLKSNFGWERQSTVC